MQKRIIAQEIYNPNPVSGPTRELDFLLKSPLHYKYTFVRVSYSKPICFNDKEMRNYYRDQLDKIKPDLFVVRGLDNDGLCAINGAIEAGVKKIIVGIHGLPSDVINQSYIKRKMKHSLVEITSLKKATCFYTVSDSAFIEHPWMKRFQKKYYGTIYNYVEDIPNFSKLDCHNSLANELGINPANTFGIYFGRFDAEKGMIPLCEALCSLFERHKELPFSFIFMGSGPMEKYICQKCKDLIDLGKVIIVGPQKDVWPYLKGSNIFVFPTFRENHSISLLEACEAGLYVLSTPVGGNKETIDDEFGSFIKPNDSKSIEDSLYKCILSKSFLINRNGWKKKKKGKFDVDTFCKRTDELYENVFRG